MTRFSIKYAVLLLSLLLSGALSAQNLAASGRFYSHHFSVIDYGSNAQIWTGVSDDAFAYFGNRNDLLKFNGYEWEKITTDPKKTTPAVQSAINESTVRKVFKASSGKIYVGRQENFGYIGYSDKGQSVYVPLFASNDDNSFGSIWNIFEDVNNQILFIGQDCIFKYKEGKKVEKVALPAGFEGYGGKTSCRFGKGLLLLYHNLNDDSEAKDEKVLYYDLMTGIFTEIFTPEHISLNNIRGSFEISGTWYLLDLESRFVSVRIKDNQLIWNAPGEIIFPELKDFAPNYISRHNDFLYYGTEDEGLIKADLNGHIVRRYNDYDELENLYVNYFFHDKDDNLWLCLDNGIQFIETSSPITTFKKREGISSLTEAIDFKSGEALLGLHTDVFFAKTALNQIRFESKKALKTSVYDIRTFETSLGMRTLAVGSDSLYEYIPKTNTRKSIGPAFAYCLRQDPDNKNTVYVTLENGIGRLTLNASGKWDYKELINDASDRTFSLVVYNGKVYFGIRNNGVGVYTIKTGKLKVIKNKVLKTVPGSAKKEESKSDYFVEFFQGQIFVGTAFGLSTVSADDSKLIPFAPEKKFFKTDANVIHRLVNIENKQLWIVNYEEVSPGKFTFVTSWLEKKNGNWEMVKWPLGGLQKAGVIASIQRDPFGNTWLGANSGIYILNMASFENYRQPFGITIDRFEINEKAVLFDPKHSKGMDALDYARNSFKIVFHANTFNGMGSMEYRYQLEGFDDQWSQWSNLNFASFQKIPEGTYTIKIQARNPYGVVSKTLTYEVTILPPWYRTFWAYALYIAALIVLIIFVTQLSTQRVKRQNQKLEETVRERTSEIAEQNNQLEHQKAEITAKTTDILDSIQYAKRIQTTILPTKTRLNELFSEHFVFYRPKDIISGDFYWAREIQGKIIFSAIDCTGHGVPGSLVSIVGNNGLLRAVNEFKLTEPHQILDKLRDIVVSAFRSEGESDVKDGMDIALCSLEPETGLLKFAGANNECVIIRNGEIFELKPDKQPIGSFIDARPFGQTEFQLEDGDCVYLFTDGYVDQFGGEKGKKFKSRQFKTMLTGLSHLPMTEQFTVIQEAFDTWKSDLDQVDDVCVFGVRYKKK